MYKVVIVDDESFVVESLKSIIDWSGYNFEIGLATTNPMEVIDYLKDNAANLLITDISMPQIDGLELIGRVRAINPLISILVLSAHDNFEYVRSAMRQGAENYLLKPLDPDELTESISQIVGQLEKREALSDVYGTSMLTFRSSFIESWVRDALGEEEFITRAQMLGINLNLDNYTVVIFTAPPATPHGNEKMSGLFDYLLSLFVKGYISHFYFESPTRLICVISTTLPDYPVARLVASAIQARNVLGFPFMIAVGREVGNYEEVPASYNDALRFLFLEYTDVKTAFAADYVLSDVALGIVASEFEPDAWQEYTGHIDKLLAALPAAKHKTVLFEVVRHVLSMLTKDDVLEEVQLVELLGKYPGSSNDRALIMRYIMEFVADCCGILTRKQQTQDSVYPYVSAVIKAVHEFSDKDISLKTLAAKLNMHPSYLGNIFHQQTGYYFNDYLNTERLKYAASLVSTTDMKLKDIVDKAGFSSQTYFNRQFKRKYGASPNAYRREHRLMTDGGSAEI